MSNQNQTKELPVVLGISGASGTVYGIKLLKFFLENDYKVDLVFSTNAFKVAKYELDLIIDGSSPSASKSSLLKLLNLSNASENLQVWGLSNVAASISSGSYKTQGMIIAPCSMASLANIAAGTSNNLLTRAADVTIKEKRKLVLLPRETPLSQIHLRNMLSLSEIGVSIVPPTPGFYHNPQTMDDLINFVLGKTLDIFGIDNNLFERWVKKESDFNKVDRLNKSILN